MPNTFAVSDVAIESGALDSVDVPTCLADRGFATLEATYAPERRLVANLGAHGLLAAVHESFAKHRPLVLSPDHIWLCVAQAVGRHVLANAEELRGRFVAHEGRRHLEVERHDFVEGSADNDWPAAIGTFSAALREILGEAHGIFVADSSTTDVVSRTASEIVMMGAVQRYFTYGVSSLCGIPELTLEGTPEDWAGLLQRTERLEGLGLEWWLPALRQALTHFARAATGDAPEKVWRQLYKAEDASGGTYTSGWINAFFPFLGELGADKRNSLTSESWPDNALEGVKLPDFPNGLVHAPFTWTLPRGQREMSFLAGFVGITQDQAGRVRPEIGWAIVPQVVRKRFHVQSWGELTTLRPRKPVESDLFEHLPHETAEMDAFAVRLDYWAGDLGPLVGVPKLVQLVLHECQKLTSLDALKHSRIPDLQVTQCRALTDIRALLMMPKLETLWLWHLDELKDWSPVVKLKGLKELRIYGRQVPEQWCGTHDTPPAIRAVQAKINAAMAGS